MKSEISFVFIAGLLCFSTTSSFAQRETRGNIADWGHAFADRYSQSDALQAMLPALEGQDLQSSAVYEKLDKLYAGLENAGITPDKLGELDSSAILRQVTQIKRPVKDLAEKASAGNTPQSELLGAVISLRESAREYAVFLSRSDNEAISRAIGRAHQRFTPEMEARLRSWEASLLEKSAVAAGGGADAAPIRADGADSLPAAAPKIAQLKAPVPYLTQLGSVRTIDQFEDALRTIDGIHEEKARITALYEAIYRAETLGESSAKAMLEVVQRTRDITGELGEPGRRVKISILGIKAHALLEAFSTSRSMSDERDRARIAQAVMDEAAHMFATIEGPWSDREELASRGVPFNRIKGTSAAELVEALKEMGSISDEDAYAGSLYEAMVRADLLKDPASDVIHQIVENSRGITGEWATLTGGGQDAMHFVLARKALIQLRALKAAGEMKDERHRDDILGAVATALTAEPKPFGRVTIVSSASESIPSAPSTPSPSPRGAIMGVLLMGMLATLMGPLSAFPLAKGVFWALGISGMILAVPELRNRVRLGDAGVLSVLLLSVLGLSVFQGSLLHPILLGLAASSGLIVGLRLITGLENVGLLGLIGTLGAIAAGGYFLGDVLVTVTMFAGAGAGVLHVALNRLIQERTVASS